MVRILNFLFVALAGLSCFAMNHIAEKTRQADITLRAVHRDIAEQGLATKKLQAEWQVVADPVRIQKLAEAHLGLSDGPTVALASLELLPRRGELAADNPVQAASMIVPVPQQGPQPAPMIHSGN